MQLVAKRRMRCFINGGSKLPPYNCFMVTNFLNRRGGYYPPETGNHKGLLYNAIKKAPLCGAFFVLLFRNKRSIKFVFIFDIMFHKMFGVATVDSSCKFLFGKGVVFELESKGNANSGTMFCNTFHVDKGSDEKGTCFVRTFAAFKAFGMAAADKFGHFGNNEIKRFNFCIGTFVFVVGTFCRKVHKIEQSVA